METLEGSDLTTPVLQVVCSVLLLLAEDQKELISLVCSRQKLRVTEQEPKKDKSKIVKTPLLMQMEYHASPVAMKVCSPHASPPFPQDGEDMALALHHFR